MAPYLTLSSSGPTVTTNDKDIQDLKTEMQNTKDYTEIMEEQFREMNEKITSIEGLEARMGALNLVNEQL